MTPPLSDAELAEMRAMQAAATKPAPAEIHNPSHDPWVGCHRHRWQIEIDVATGVLNAAAPESMAKLLGEVERLQQLNKALFNCIGQAGDENDKLRKALMNIAAFDGCDDKVLSVWTYAMRNTARKALEASDD